MVIRRPRAAVVSMMEHRSFARPSSLSSRVWDAFVRPERPEERNAVRRVWDDLPPEVQTEDQLLGRHSAGCAATYGTMEACNFYCTACYLADEANHTPPLPFAEVKAQLDQIRDYLGPGGSTQITAGEVTLLPCDELIRILQYCRQIELTPMVMTNGQVFLQQPDYLHRLILEGGLDRVGIHVDITQKGRLGLRKNDTEVDIHWIRDAMANLVRRARKITGRTLHAAHTFTVTERNFDDVPSVMAWMAKNVDAFRMVSFQPTADVGRTRAAQQTGRRPALWAQIQKGLGHAINPQPLKFGHPDCNSVSLSFVARFRNADGVDEVHLMDVVRAGETGDEAFLRDLLHRGFAGFTPGTEPGPVVLARVLGRIRKNPHYLVDIPAYCARRIYADRPWIRRLVAAAAAGRPFFIKPLSVVVHDFMSADELQTERGQVRLKACSFRVPIDGRMVSMCELNGTELRKQLNLADQARMGRERLRVLTGREPVSSSAVTA